MGEGLVRVRNYDGLLIVYFGVGWGGGGERAETRNQAHPHIKSNQIRSISS